MPRLLWLNRAERFISRQLLVQADLHVAIFSPFRPQVASGHVGLSAIGPALQALGHDVIALPTTILSNHPGHAKVAGSHVDPQLLHEILAALDGNGWLAGMTAVLTGYLPSREHVAFACAAMRSHPAPLVHRHRRMRSRHRGCAGGRLPRYVRQPRRSAMTSCLSPTWRSPTASN